MRLQYKYLGDKFSDEKFKKQLCIAVQKPDGKCIRGQNGNMLVEFSCGTQVVIVARLLRKLAPVK